MKNKTIGIRTISIIFLVVFGILFSIQNSEAEEEKPVPQIKRGQITLEEAYKRKAKNNVKSRYSLKYFQTDKDKKKDKKSAKEVKKGKNRRTTETRYGKHWKNLYKERLESEE